MAKWHIYVPGRHFGTMNSFCALRKKIGVRWNISDITGIHFVLPASPIEAVRQFM